jgi:hypothetical protein
MMKPRRMRLAGNQACIPEDSNAYAISVRDLEESEKLKRPIRRREDATKIVIREMDAGIGLIHFAQDTHQWQCLVNLVINLEYNVGNFSSE